MGLTAEQKNLVKAWMAAGLKDYEIIRLAKEQVPPFHITKQNLSKNYRRDTERKIRDIVDREQQESILRTGLAVKENRIKALQEIYERAGRELGGSDKRGNVGLLNVQRGCLDDIAKEMGERREKLDVEANVQIRDIAAIMNRIYGDD